MKFCLSSQCSEKLLSQADEIKTKHFKEVKPLLRKFKNAIVIYEVQTSDTDEIFQELKELMKEYEYSGRLVCCCRGLDQLIYFNKFFPTLKAYNGFYVSTYLEARACVDNGAVYLKIGAPLTHDLENVSRLEVPIRLTPNIAYEDAVYVDYAFQGSWIRPEDYDTYDKYNVIYEFEDCDKAKETTLFDIYKNKKNWPGPISYLISNINTEALNRLIPPDLAAERIRCKQKCLVNGRCHLCESYFILADKNLLEKVIHP